MNDIFPLCSLRGWVLSCEVQWGSENLCWSEDSYWHTHPVSYDQKHMVSLWPLCVSVCHGSDSPCFVLSTLSFTHMAYCTSSTSLNLILCFVERIKLLAGISGEKKIYGSSVCSCSVCMCALACVCLSFIVQSKLWKSEVKLNKTTFQKGGTGSANKSTKSSIWCVLPGR